MLKEKDRSIVFLEPIFKEMIWGGNKLAPKFEYKIPSVISPDLLKILMEMGHGDEIVIGDGNFPGHSINENCIRCDGHGVPELLEAILKLFPLDTYQKPVYIMDKIKGDNAETPIWDKYAEIIKPYTDEKIEKI